MHIDAYLDRIGYTGAREPSATTLSALHLAHLLAVPFENLNIARGWPIELDEAALFEKIVVRRRGGFCYELNGLFAMLLRALGYEVTLLAAGVARAEGGFGPAFDHLTLLVRAPLGEPGPWLADVGFGDSFHMPLRLTSGIEQPDRARSYLLVRAGEDWTLHERAGDAPSAPQYRFTLAPRALGEYAEMCYYHQTSPESSFTRKRICSRATPSGRISLSGQRLIITESGERSEHDLPDEAACTQALREHFGVVLANGT